MASSASWLILLTLPLAALTPGEEFFENKIRPVLATQCVGCHNSQLKAPFGGLRLDSRQAMLKGGDSGPAIVPGDANASLLLRALRYENRKLQMPPTGRLKDDVIEAFREWINMGAPDPRTEAPIQTTSTATPPLWSLTPPRQLELPSVVNANWLRSDIDRFVLAKLESKQLQPAASVDRRVFIRRLSFDLRGLPPTLQEIRDYLADSSSQAEERLVDRFLASPHYGERMARHWMDLVRFSETNGHEFDNDKNDAWRYRDYLIRAFNEDLPYNQLVQEHIAGDLLEQPRLANDGTIFESPLGTGFYWFGEVLNSATDSVKTRADRVDNQIDVISKAFLGLTVSCARCHDHKFDPIPTRDYYGLAGILHNTYVREAVLDTPGRQQSIAAARASIAKVHREPTISGGKLQLREGDQVFANFDSLQGWHNEGQAFAAGPRDSAISSRGEGSMALVGSLTSQKFRMPKMYAHVRLAGSTPDKKRFSGGDLRVTLVADDHKSEQFHAEPEWRWKTIRMTKEFGRECYFEIVDRSRSGFIAVDAIVLSDSAEPPQVEGGEIPLTFADPSVEVPESAFGLISFDESAKDLPLHLRGSHENLGEIVPRGALTKFPHQTEKIQSGSGRRELATWLSSPQNPLVARVIVNRIWRQHFGQGLVRSVDNFGRMGEAPAHLDLLDHLTSRFVSEGWSIKQLHRKIVLSAAYRMGHNPQNSEAQKLDPRNELLWHYPPRRLEAEAIRDSMLAVSQSLDLTLYGPGIPPHISPYQDGRGKPASGPLDGANRRSLYTQVRRNFLPPLFLAFDYPPPISTIGARGSATVPAQALMLLNNELVHLAASRWASASESQSSRLDWLYETAFGRLPNAQESEAAATYLKDHNWQSLCHILLNSAEFLYVQ